MKVSGEYVTLVQGAAAIELLARCSEGFSQITLDYRYASVLHRLIRDTDYRLAALDMHSELFTAKDPPEKLPAIISEVAAWLNQMPKSDHEPQSALGTEDTPHTSRESSTKP